MNKTILFTILAAFTLLVGTSGTNIFAQNVTQSANETGEGAQVAMNETGEAFTNFSESVTEGLQDIMNGSSK